MNTIYAFLLLIASLVALSLVVGAYSTRWGFSHLLVFLAMGMAAGVDGLLGVRFDAQALTLGVGQLALAVILLDGGLRTSWRSVRLAWAPAALLATVGVALTAAIVAVATAWALSMDWRHALLMGAVVASTDAAAVFQQLQHGGVRLRARLAATLEVESGLNDPVAVFLVLACLGAIEAGQVAAPELLRLLAMQAAVGLALGWGGAWLTGRLLNRLPIGLAPAPGPGGRAPRTAPHGLSALLLGAIGVAVFALTGLLDGSGFLAVYVFGLRLARRHAEVVRPALPALDGYAWLAQASLFLLLGLLVTPSEVWRFALPALAIAAVLMLVARPLAVALCLAPWRVGLRETAFVSWVGLRGAVPIVLALYPVVRGVEGAYLYFDVAFVVVLASLLLQGPSTGWLARRLRLSR